MPAATPSPDMLEAEARAGEIARELGGPPQDPAGLREFLKRAGAWWNAGGPASVAERDVEIVTLRGPLAGRLYQPEQGQGAPLWIYLHGGGFRFGGLETNARQLREIAALWGGNILSLDYPMLPSARFPVAVEHVAMAYAQLPSDGTRLGFDGMRMAWGGASAGASISAGAAVQAAVSGDRLCAGVLICPVANGASDTVSMAAYGDGPWFPTRAAATETWQAYTGPHGDRGDPRANLLRAEPGLFPPMLVACAEIDAFASGGAALARRIAEAGGECRHIVYPGVTHLFFNYSRMLGEARRCISDIAAFLSEHLPVGASPLKGE